MCDIMESRQITASLPKNVVTFQPRSIRSRKSKNSYLGIQIADKTKK